MRFTVGERIHLGGLLPKMGDFTTLKLVREVVESLSFDEEEHKKLQFRQEGNRTIWRVEGAAEIGEKDIHIPSVIHDAVRQELQRLDKEKKLPYELMGLYEKFVPNKAERKAAKGKLRALPQAAGE